MSWHVFVSVCLTALVAGTLLWTPVARWLGAAGHWLRLRRRYRREDWWPSFVRHHLFGRKKLTSRRRPGRIRP